MGLRARASTRMMLSLSGRPSARGKLASSEEILMIRVGHIVPDALPLLVVDRAPPVLDDVLQDLHAIRITKCVIEPAGVASREDEQHCGALQAAGAAPTGKLMRLRGLQAGDTADCMPYCGSSAAVMAAETSGRELTNVAPRSCP